MLSTHGRTFASALLKPAALLLLRLRIGPDAVSLTATAGVVIAALALIPTGHLATAALVIAAFALCDTIDGLMARELAARGIRRSKDFGAFLDSTLDRVADGAIFAGLVLWFAGAFHAGLARPLDLILALACLVFGSVVPYARARAEGLGMTASGGIAERADRLVAVLVAMLVTGLGAPAWVMTIVLFLLALASGYTVVQRVRTVQRQSMQRLVDEVNAERAAQDEPLTRIDPVGVQMRAAALDNPDLWAARSGTRSSTRTPRHVEPWLVRRRRRHSVRAARRVR